MNENDIWKILDDRENITAYAISAEEEDVVILFGGGLSKDEQYKIISADMEYKTEAEEIYEMQSELLIGHLVKAKKMSLSAATKLWYNSATKREIQDSDTDYSHVAPTRCYSELLMELSKDPDWMKESFD